MTVLVDRRGGPRLRRRVGRRPRPARPLRRVRHVDRRRVVGAHHVRPRRRRGRRARRPVAPQGPPAVAGRRRRRGVRRRLARRRLRDVAHDAARRPRRPGRRGDAAARRLAAGARRHRARRRRRLEPGPALVGAGRRHRRGDRTGPRRRPHRSCSTGGRSSSSRPRSSPARWSIALEPAARALRREGHVHGRPGHQAARRDRRQHRLRPRLRGARRRRCSSACCWRSRCGATARCRAPLLVSALPLGMLIGRRFQSAPPIDVALGGAALLALGLAGAGDDPGRRAAHGRGRVRWRAAPGSTSSTRSSTGPPCPPTVRPSRPARSPSAPATPGSCSASR